MPPLPLFIAADAGAALLSTYPCCGDGHGVDISRFQHATQSLLDLSNSSFASWLFYIEDADRTAFEANGQAAAALEGIPYPGGIMTLTAPPLTTLAPDAPFYYAQWASAPHVPAVQAFFMADSGSTSDPARNDLLARCANSSMPAVFSEFIVPLISFSPTNPLVSPVSQVCQSSWCVPAPSGIGRIDLHERATNFTHTLPCRGICFRYTGLT